MNKLFNIVFLPKYLFILLSFPLRFFVEKSKRKGEKNNTVEKQEPILSFL